MDCRNSEGYVSRVLQLGITAHFLHQHHSFVCGLSQRSWIYRPQSLKTNLATAILAQENRNTSSFSSSPLPVRRVSSWPGHFNSDAGKKGHLRFQESLLPVSRVLQKSEHKSSFNCVRPEQWLTEAFERIKRSKRKTWTRSPVFQS